MLKLATLATALLVAAPSIARADCDFSGLVPQVLPTDAKVPADGGVLVAAQPKGGSALGSGDVTVQRGWRFRGIKASPTIDVLAPGLAVYRLPAGDGSIVLEDDKQAAVATVTPTKEKRARLAAPKVKAITFQHPVSRRVMDQVVVELDGEPPAEAAALVIADAKGAPRSWGRVSGRSVTAYASHSCIALPNGTVMSKAGDQVVVYFVDNVGRKSDPTKPIAVTAK
jgi:hypothetical protein